MVKALFLGDAAVGKTTVLIAYVQGEFITEHIPTVFDNYTANIVVEKATVPLVLWDTAGHEEFNNLRRLQYPKADIFVIMYCINDKNSFYNITKTWINELAKYSDKPFMIVGNKSDLRTDEDDCVSQEEALELAANLGASAYAECSAKTREGLEDLFETCVRVITHPKSLPKLKSKKKEKEGCTVQ